MPSFGETLRRQRELRQISLREVSEATKINLRYLEALEKNEFADLPGGAFTRGYIRAYARHIGVDDSEMIDAYSYEMGQQATQNQASDVGSLLEHFDIGCDRNEELRRRRARILVIVLGIVLLCAIIGGGAWALAWWFDWGPYALAALPTAAVS